MNALLKNIEHKINSGERLTRDDGIALYNCRDIIEIGRLANIVRQKKHGDIAYYTVNSHINHTNICVNNCRFCAFSREKGEEGAYEMHIDQVLESANDGYDEFHIVGGCHPDFPYEYYSDIISKLKSKYPKTLIQAFTAVEIDHIAKLKNLTIEEALNDLKSVGLDSLPGGGAEVFSDRIRKELFEKKIPADRWLEIHGVAHKNNIPTNATMLYGHIEIPEEKVDHLIRLRDQQDKTGGFLAFIPLAFHPQNTKLDTLANTSGYEDLRELAISRLMLDNFPHIKAFWIMIGEKLSQVSLWFGVDDVDGTVEEEKITHMAGAKTPKKLAEERLRNLIKKAGFKPVRRDTLYNIIDVND
ncbi:aminofutalosine synthase MqnE [bacterium]|nr:aminofutalosine synthase MqnE [bacterium]MBU1026009.1 aminofutalosine synthase MqnE [bacterium]